MWSTGIFISEMCGMFVFVFMSLFTVLASKSSIIALKENEKRFFIVIGVSLELVLAILVALGIARASGVRELGYVNPGVALAHAISIGNFDYLLPAWFGEITGSLLASTLVLAIFLVSYGSSPIALLDAKETFAFPQSENPILRSALGELIASFLFIGIVLAIIWGDAPTIMIGFALALILLTFGLRFNLVINVFATTIPMFVGILITKPSARKLSNSVQEITIGSATNFSACTILGAFYSSL